MQDDNTQQDAPVEREYFFPTLGVTVTATSLEDGYIAALEEVESLQDKD